MSAGRRRSPARAALRVRAAATDCAAGSATRGAGRGSWCWSPGCYIVWSIVPVLIAIQFSFNDSRSLHALARLLAAVVHGGDPNIDSVYHSADLRGCLEQSMKLAALDVIIATPIGVALALGLARWRGRGSGASNFLMLFPLVTPEIVMGVSLLLLFTPSAHVHPHRHPGQLLGHVTFSISYVVVIVRGRLFSIGRSLRGGGGRPGRVAVAGAVPGAAAAAAAGDRRQRRDRVRDLDRRLRDQPVAVGRREHRHRADAIYVATRAAPLPSTNAHRDGHAWSITLLPVVAGVLVCRLFTRGERSGGSRPCDDFAAFDI